ncbi:MAG TPA: histidine kinase N-terminal domain-containing protein [Anaerolineae bacterium]|nr:histidine kinase N-terminal domain-containing protein [Anaerolineae bacterium]
MEHTNWRSGFSVDELQLLERVECGVALTADISRADVMLLVQQDESALVIAQAQPHSIASLYRSPWTGQLLPLIDHPLLAAGLRDGRRTSEHRRNVLEQGTPIVEQVMPVVSERGRPIAVLQIETNLIAWERHRRRHQSFRSAVGWLQEMTLRGELACARQLSPFGEWDGVLFVDQEYRIRYLSGIANNLYRRLNYLNDLQGEHIGDLNTKDELLVRLAFETGDCQEHEVLEGNRYWNRKVVPLLSYETNRWPFAAKMPKAMLRGALIMVHDETEEREKAVELHVKSTMIKEVHHRVKNNLQTVASILRMQSRRAENPEVQLQLNEAVNRVLAVAVIHEFLSRDDDQAINIRDVCQRIVTQTQRAAVMPDKQITLRVQGPAIYLPSQQATACALVANELVLNALEHAFNGREQGTVLMQLADEGDQVVLEVIDDGVGLLEAADREPSGSLGLTIVRTLVEGDLKGQLVMERADPGTRVIVRFRKEVRSGG